MNLSLRAYTFIWLAIAAVFSFEYYCVNNGLYEYSTLNYLRQNYEFFYSLNMDLSAGKPISYYLGWTGFVAMCLTNLYILRKHLSFMSKWGNLKNWLNFHIFLGLLGPTLIIFHTNMKVGGLVALSFWSMMIVALSGIVGRYFYVQTLTKKEDLLKSKDQAKEDFIELAKEYNVFDEIVVKKTLRYASDYVGIRHENSGILNVMYNSLLGDLKLMKASIPSIGGLPSESKLILKKYALSKRKSIHFSTFNKLLGHWHTLHIPFAIVMYVAAVIHIIVALLFQVR